MGKYYDSDLNPLFKECSDEELSDIVDVILKNSFNKLKKHDKYVKIRSTPSQFLGVIGNEVRRMGSNDIATFFRDEGIPYREIVEDVATRIRLPEERWEECDDVASLEKEILIYMLERAYEEMTAEQRADFEKTFREASYSDFGDFSSIPFTVGLMSAVINASGFTAYKVTAIVVNAVLKQVLGRGLSFLANATLMRGLSILAGPIGLAISGIWLGIDIAGPAYRTTIPLVVVIASLRMKKEGEKRERNNAKLKIADTSNDPYSILEIYPEDSDEVIRRAYLSKCKKFHPDKFAIQDEKTREWAESEFKKINNAYDKILKKRKRS